MSREVPARCLLVVATAPYDPLDWERAVADVGQLYESDQLSVFIHPDLDAVRLCFDKKQTALDSLLFDSREQLPQPSERFGQRLLVPERDPRLEVLAEGMGSIELVGTIADRREDLVSTGSGTAETRL